jgi:nucleoside-diphosphate-sugar epimerase
LDQPSTSSSVIRRVLVIGASGQIGSELTPYLRARYGEDNVVAADLRIEASHSLAQGGPWQALDVTDRGALDSAITSRRIDTVVNLAAILSATGEQHPDLCWSVNINGLINTLEAARDHKLTRVMIPSSIAVFGQGAPKHNTPQETVLMPTTMYGLTKVSGELLCGYYFKRYGVDARGLRYPGIISHSTPPGGGTTDYAVEIFHEALRNGHYACFLGPDTALPMMYMPDCLRATLMLLEAPLDKLIHHGDFNVSAMSFTPAQLAAEIARYVPGFEISYAPDYRQAIADSWPASIDDSAARGEWGWKPEYDLGAMVADMLANLRAKQSAAQSQQ